MEGRSIITLTVADNGIIKEITDYNVNGTQGDEEYLIVYEYTENKAKNKEKSLKILNDLIEDLDLDIGTSDEMNVIAPSYIRGEKYIPTQSFLESEILNLESKLLEYKKMLDNLRES